MRITTYLERARGPIERELDRLLPGASRWPATLHRAMRYSVFAGGKRIRPILLVEAAKVCGAALRSALPAACAVELVHTYSLIHDDLPAMDNDDLRRGKPSSHKKFGEANAILAGDALLTHAFGVLACRLDARVSPAAISELAAAIGSEGMVGGQALDMAGKTHRLHRAAIVRIAACKTARLFEASTVIGAIVAGADRRRQRAMRLYGRSIGMAFQIVDDIMDNEDYAALVGKTAARRDAARAIAHAKSALRPFGRRAAALNALADYLLMRTT